jgi:hypothetical protein
MKKYITFFLLSFILLIRIATAQNLKSNLVTPAVVTALETKYPEIKKVTWEKEKGNYEANWGGKSGEDNSVLFKPDGTFIEIVKAIPVTQLPVGVQAYVTAHYKTRIKEVGKVTDATGKVTYEAQVKGGDLIFDEKGIFIKKD